jgi:hypothetical protein
MIDFLILMLISIAESRWAMNAIPTRDVPTKPGEKPGKYLSRWFLLGGPKTEGLEDGLSKSWGLYLHCFHRSDDSDKLHSHPWKWAVSFVLKNGYVEDRLETTSPTEWGRGGQVTRREVRAGRLNFLRGTTFHRVDLDRGEAWTLFLVGPGVADWGFLELASPYTGRKERKFIPWRTFLKKDVHAERE